MKVTKKIEVVIDLTDNNHLELLAEMQGLEFKMRTEGVDINSTFLADGQEAPIQETKKPTPPPAKKATPPTVKAEEVKETPAPEAENVPETKTEEAPLPITEEDTLDTTQTTAPKISIDDIKALIAKVASDYDKPEKKAEAIKLLNSHKDVNGEPVKTSLKLQTKDYDAFYAELSKIWDNGN